MKIILDAMGGDFAPEAPVMGAIDAAKAYGAQIVLVGRGNEILEVLKKNGIDNLPEGFTIKRTHNCIFSASSWDSPMYCASNAHQREIRDKRAAAVERILVELELGATKADLERLIEEAIA